MNQEFMNELGKLRGKVIDSIAVGEIDGYMLFQYEVDGIYICTEVAKDMEHSGGRCFLLKKGEVDGAGVFPLSDGGRQ